MSGSMVARSGVPLRFRCVHGNIPHLSSLPLRQLSQESRTLIPRFQVSVPGETLLSSNLSSSPFILSISSSPPLPPSAFFVFLLGFVVIFVGHLDDLLNPFPSSYSLIFCLVVSFNFSQMWSYYPTERLSGRKHAGIALTFVQSFVSLATFLPARF